MSRSQSVQEQLVELRKEERDRGEPLNIETRTVHYSGNSLVVSLTHFATVAHDLDKTDSVSVETYSNGIWIETPD